MYFANGQFDKNNAGSKGTDLVPSNERKLIIMFSNISFNDYRCQLESRIPSSPVWAKHEKMAYCEDFSALISEKRASKFDRIITTLVISLFK